MPYADISELPPEVQDAYSTECQQVFVDAFNAAEGDDATRFPIAHTAATACEEARAAAADAATAGIEADAADCGCGDGMKIGRKEIPLDEAAISDSGEFSGYANVFNIVDDGGDKVLPGAFKPTLDEYLKSGFISWNHDWGNPVAFPTEASEDERGLLIKAEFHGTPRAQEARQIVADRVGRGKSVGLSIGYEVDQAKETSYGRDIKSFKRLFETGLVMVPMNRDSTVTAAKGVLASGHSFGERLALVAVRTEVDVREIENLLAHADGRAHIRKKEGRVLSRTTREQITTLVKLAKEISKTGDKLLAETDPEKGKAAQQAFLRSIQTLAGIS